MSPDMRFLGLSLLDRSQVSKNFITEITKNHGVPRSQPACCTRTAMVENGVLASCTDGTAEQRKNFDRRCTQIHADSTPYRRASACIGGRFSLRSNRRPGSRFYFQGRKQAMALRPKRIKRLQSLADRRLRAGRIAADPSAFLRGTPWFSASSVISLRWPSPPLASTCGTIATASPR
jgi:hypothetical protein